MSIAIESGARRYDIAPRVPDRQSQREALIRQLVIKGVGKPITYIKEKGPDIIPEKVTIGCILEGPQTGEPNKILLFATGDYAVVSPTDTDDREKVVEFDWYFNDGMRIYSLVHEDPQKAARDFSTPGSDADFQLPFIIKKGSTTHDADDEKALRASVGSIVLKSAIKAKAKNILAKDWRERSAVNHLAFFAKSAA